MDIKRFNFINFKVLNLEEYLVSLLFQISLSSCVGLMEILDFLEFDLYEEIILHLQRNSASSGKTLLFFRGFILFYFDKMLMSQVVHLTVILQPN